MIDMESLNKQAGKLVAECRKKLHIPQEELASFLGVTRTSISNIERGKQALSLSTFCKVADYLHVSPDLLLKQIIELQHDTLTITEDDVPDLWVREMMNRKLSEATSSSADFNGGRSNE
jgi:transcriptional regulator with XRE-family HTH domain